MRHLRMLGLCLVAAFAVAAVAATSASALPEFGKCVVEPNHQGLYTNNVCTKKAKLVEVEGKKVGTGEFEFHKVTKLKEEGAKLHFKSEGAKGVLATILEFCVRGDQKVNPFCEGKEFEDKGEVKVECESENGTGVINGNTTVGNIAVKFHGCKIFETAPCQNTSNEGEIVVNVLKGKLGFINKSVSPREVGIVLNPAKSKGEFAKFTCAGFITSVVGVGPEIVKNTAGEEVKMTCVYPETHCGGDGIISPITPVNTMTTQTTQVYTVNEKDENIPSHFEGKPIELLEDWAFNNEEPEFRTAWSPAGEELTNVNTTEEEGEIKAN